jgi:hypothetical protein
MRKTICSLLLLYGFLSASAQDPLHWQYSAKQVNDTTWAVHFTATIDGGWHVYSQTQPESSVAQPTEFHFTASPLIRIKGKTKESGEVVHFSDPATGIGANQYNGRVDFVQTVIRKAKAKISLTGTITYQTCTDQMCLPPKTVPFTVEMP